MMLTSILRRFAPGAAALLLGLAGSLAIAQDASPPGPPAVDPKAQPKDKKAVPPNGPINSVLPGVPATASDPAPPGTRAVRVDRQGPVNPAAVRTARKLAGSAAQIFHAEGVVTRIDRAGKNVNGELERFAFDPSQDWTAYVSGNVKGIPDKDATRPKTNNEIQTANAKQHQDDPDHPTVLEMSITKRTYTYTHARTEDGTDLYAAATSASPDQLTSRSGAIRRVPAPGTTLTPTAPTPTNFTNIKEGSFVSVRYRKVGDVNEVLNLTLIALPLNPTDVNGQTGENGANRGTSTTTTRPAAGAPRPGERTPSVPTGGVGTVNIPK